MIRGLVIQKLTIAGKKYEYPDTTALVGKINELADAVNKLETMVKNTNTVLESLVVENNIHEKQMKVEPEKCEIPAENVQDKFAEQRKWIGCLVRYKICDWQGGWATDVLEEIVEHPIYPFKMRNGQTAQVCELVTADEIYPNKARTW